MGYALETSFGGGGERNLKCGGRTENKAERSSKHRGNPTTGLG